MPENGPTNWYSDDAATFGDRVAAAREARGMTQDILAPRLGVALRTVERWENDIAEPRANKLQMLAGMLDVSMSWLLTGEGSGVVPGEDADHPDVSALRDEVAGVRAEFLKLAERLGTLEERVAGVGSEPAV